MSDPAEGSPPPPAPRPAIDDEATGLPGLRRWPAVYAWVLGTLVAWVALLWWLTAAYS